MLVCLSGEIGRRTGLKILRESYPVPVQVWPQAPNFLLEEYPSWLKGLVLKTSRSCKRRQGSNPYSSAIQLLISRDGAVRQLAGLITLRSLVQIQLPQPFCFWSRGVAVITFACHAKDREFDSRRDRHFYFIFNKIIIMFNLWLCSSVGRAQD